MRYLEEVISFTIVTNCHCYEKIMHVVNEILEPEEWRKIESLDDMSSDLNEYSKH